MRIHKSDARDIAPRGCKTWQEIMEMVKQRAIERAGILSERRVMGQIMKGFVET